MIKRPLTQRFHQKVIEGIKISTIRPNPWPVGVPIQLYHWEDKPYRSKQVNGPVVIVSSSSLITRGRLRRLRVCSVQGQGHGWMKTWTRYIREDEAAALPFQVRAIVPPDELKLEAI